MTMKSMNLLAIFYWWQHKKRRCRKTYQFFFCSIWLWSIKRASHIKWLSFRQLRLFCCRIYIKKLFELNSPSLSFLAKIAQGSIIKSAISNENLKLTIFSNKYFYFDTKILFRLLGYYGNYYQKEYETLFSELRQQKANLRITEYVYYEALSILRGCEKYIDSAEYQYEKHRMFFVIFDR